MMWLLEKLLGTELFTRMMNRHSVTENREVPEDLVKYGGDAFHLAHGRDQAIWFYNVSNNDLRLSKTARNHNDRAAFGDDPYTGEEWIRGRIFEYHGKFYAFVYTGASTDFPGLAARTNYNLLTQVVPDLIRQIEDKFGGIISYVVDEDSRTIDERKK